MGGEREPVRTYRDLAGLDEGEIGEGYRDGREGLPCGGNRTRAYWHGWRNGRTDAGLEQPDEAQRALVRDVVNIERVRGRA